MNKAEAVGTATQMAFETTDPGWEHIDDMLRCYTDNGDKPPCTGDELYELVNKAVLFKETGLLYKEVIDKMMN
jgi:hypothetical protein